MVELLWLPEINMNGSRLVLIYTSHLHQSFQVAMKLPVRFFHLILIVQKPMTALEAAAMPKDDTTMMGLVSPSLTITRAVRQSPRTSSSHFHSSFPNRGSCSDRQEPPPFPGGRRVTRR